MGFAVSALFTLPPQIQSAVRDAADKGDGETKNFTDQEIQDLATLVKDYNQTIDNKTDRVDPKTLAYAMGQLDGLYGNFGDQDRMWTRAAELWGFSRLAQDWDGGAVGKPGPREPEPSNRTGVNTSGRGRKPTV